jgi:ribosomal protein L16 Arg81 hydroxylase
LCSAALAAKDPDELLQIVQELNKVLKHEEQVRQDFRHAMKTAESSSEIRG